MVRRPRDDHPGTWHHVYNRGIARRTLFESQADIRFFLARLAREMRHGQIEIHAFAILTTHFHLLIRSVTGDLSAVMRRVEQAHVRRFNRLRRRDGPLLRGRFMSRLVDSIDYRVNLIRYIDANPVEAGLVSEAVAYPYCSGWWYARSARPLWLERSWVESVVIAARGLRAYDPAAYGRVFGASPSPGFQRLIDRRWTSRGRADALTELLGAAPQRVLAWMRRKAMLADGTDPGVPVVDPESVVEALAPGEECPGFQDDGANRSRSVALAGLLRDLTSATWEEIGARVGCSGSQAFKLHRRHLQVMLDDDVYAKGAAEAVRRALGRCHGST